MQEVFENIIEKLEEEKNKTFFIETSRPQTQYRYGNSYRPLFDTAIKIVNEVAEEYNNGWIPVSKNNSPKENGRYIACLNHACACELTFKDGRWFNPYNGNEYLDVTAWQPLPELPEPYQPKGDKE